jgi:hypothetical protein
MCGGVCRTLRAEGDGGGEGVCLVSAAIFAALSGWAFLLLLPPLLPCVTLLRTAASDAQPSGRSASAARLLGRLGIFFSRKTERWRLGLAVGERRAEKAKGDGDGGVGEGMVDG